MRKLTHRNDNTGTICVNTSVAHLAGHSRRRRPEIGVVKARFSHPEIKTESERGPSSCRLSAMVLYVFPAIVRGRLNEEVRPCEGRPFTPGGESPGWLTPCPPRGAAAGCFTPSFNSNRPGLVTVTSSHHLSSSPTPSFGGAT